MNRSMRMVRSISTALLLLTPILAGCAGGGTTRAGGNPDLITQEQIDLMPEGTAYTIIQRFRPAWLRARAPASLNTREQDYPPVFLNETYYGPIDVLRGISSNQIQSIEYIDARDATTRYGTGYPAGIIRVTTFGRE